MLCDVKLAKDQESALNDVSGWIAIWRHLLDIYTGAEPNAEALLRTVLDRKNISFSWLVWRAIRNVQLDCDWQLEEKVTRDFANLLEQQGFEYYSLLLLLHTPHSLGRGIEVTRLVTCCVRRMCEEVSHYSWGKYHWFRRLCEELLHLDWTSLIQELAVQALSNRTTRQQSFFTCNLKQKVRQVQRDHRKQGKLQRSDVRVCPAIF